MYKKYYNSMLDKIEPENALINKTKEKIRVFQNQKPFKIKRFGFAVVCITFFVLLVTIVVLPKLIKEPNIVDNTDSETQTLDNTTTEALIETGSTENISDRDIEGEPIYIPAVSIEGVNPATSDMAGMFFYNGNAYVQKYSDIDVDNLSELMGEKIGTLSGNLDDWNIENDDERYEFASNCFGDVYIAKGYDSNFRLIVREDKSGLTVGYFDNDNDILINTGKDLYDKRKVLENIKSVYWENFEDFEYSRNIYREVKINDDIIKLIEEVYEAPPIKYNKLNHLFNDRDNDHQKFLKLKLIDGSSVIFRLFSSGFVYTQDLDSMFFKINEAIMQAVWDYLSEIPSSEAQTLDNAPTEALDETAPTENISDRDIEGQPIYIPATNLVDTNPQVADMDSVFFYNGNAYWDSKSDINTENLSEILGEKIGSINDISNNWDIWKGNRNFTSLYGYNYGDDYTVYTAKGYDSSFRLILYMEKPDGLLVRYFDNDQDILINKGKDLYDKRKVLGNIQSVYWENFDDFYLSRNISKEVKINDDIIKLVEEIYEAPPIEYNKLSHLVEERDDEHQKYLKMKLTDSSSITLQIFSSGFVYTVDLNVSLFFKINEATMKAVWDYLQ